MMDEKINEFWWKWGLKNQLKVRKWDVCLRSFLKIKGVVNFEKKTSFQKKLYHVFNEDNYLVQEKIK